MKTDRQVDVGTLLGSIAEMMEENQQNLNATDSARGAGTHGDRIAAAFRTAAQAARDSGTDDAGQQLSIAAQAMRETGRGRSTGFYADGLEEAAQQFGGQSGISLSSLGPFLEAFLSGVQRNNPARPGQGTMIDALGPAVGALINNRSGNPAASALEALSEAVTGARGTTRNGRVDPGAASATSVIGGIVQALLPGILAAIMSRGLGGILGGGRQQPEQQVPTMPERDVAVEEPQGGGGLGDILGRILGGGRREEPEEIPTMPQRDVSAEQPRGGSGGLDDLIGDIMGGSQGRTGSRGGGGILDNLDDILGNLAGRQAPQQPSQQGGKPPWWPF